MLVACIVDARHEVALVRELVFHTGEAYCRIGAREAWLGAMMIRLEHSPSGGLSRDPRQNSVALTTRKS